MNRSSLLLRFAVTIGLLAVLNLAVTDRAWADTTPGASITVILADGAAVRQAERGAELTTSFMGLVTMLHDDRLIMFASAEKLSQMIGPFGARDVDFAAILREIKAKLDTPIERPEGSLANALAEAHGILGEARASADSSIFLITGTSSRDDFELQSRYVKPLIPRFVKKGWTINGLSLPDASPESTEFLAGLSTSTGGEVFKLSVTEGLDDLADALLRQGAKGSLTEVGRRVLTPDELMTSVISVAPGTRETTMVFAKESRYGSLRLSNPSGIEASAGDRTASYVVETPNIVIWRLIDPAPGDWKVDARGMDGLLSTWQYSFNKYSLVLGTSAPVPLDSPATLMASVQDDSGSPVMLEGVQLLANITTPEGTRLVLEMKDDGAGSDAERRDGYYTSVLPPLATGGSYKVELELSWFKYAYRIASQSSFQAQAYPSLEVKTEELGSILPGERTKVGTVFVHVEGSPYPVDKNHLIALVSSEPEQGGLLELEPKRLYGEGPAWEYDVFFTPRTDSLHSIVLRLSLSYAGRPFVRTSEPIVVSSASPIPPTAPAVEAAAVAPVATSVAQVAPVPQPVAVEPGFPWAALIVPVTVIVAISVGAAYLLTRPRPHGFLYNDRDEPLIDFSKLARHPILEVLFRSSVRGNELNVPGLEGLVFHFSRNRIRIVSAQERPTVRINNQPLVGEAEIRDRTWIGTHGRLYTFLLSALPAHGSAIAD